MQPLFILWGMKVKTHWRRKRKICGQQRRCHPPSTHPSSIQPPYTRPLSKHHPSIHQALITSLAHAFHHDRLHLGWSVVTKHWVILKGSECNSFKTNPHINVGLRISWQKWCSSIPLYLLWDHNWTFHNENHWKKIGFHTTMEDCRALRANKLLCLFLCGITCRQRFG